jgi:OOP family OmpA-OmpF porin
MKKIFTVLAAAAALTSFNSAEAMSREGFYIGGLGGGNFLHTRCKPHYNTGYAAGGFLGYEWCDGLRVEAEGTYRHNTRKLHHAGDADNERSKNHLHSWSFMGNVLYDFNISGWDSCLPCWSSCWTSCITPYVGAGIGWSHQRFQHASHHNKYTGFAWQVIGGLAYEINECMDIALDYRFNKGHAERIYNNSLSALVRYKF